MNVFLKNRRLQSFLIFGLSGTLVGFAIRVAAGTWPELAPVGLSFFIAWWIAAAVGSILMPLGRAS